jgi:hypothetical protein
MLLRSIHSHSLKPKRHHVEKRLDKDPFIVPLSLLITVSMAEDIGQGSKACLQVTDASHGHQELSKKGNGAVHTAINVVPHQVTSLALNSMKSEIPALGHAWAAGKVSKDQAVPDEAP